MHDKPCLRCGGSETVAGAKVLEVTHESGSRELRVTVYTVPPSGLFRGALVTQPLKARVCSNCGHTEMYVESPEVLREAAERAAKAP